MFWLMGALFFPAAKAFPAFLAAAATDLTLRERTIRWCLGYTTGAPTWAIGTLFGFRAGLLALAVLGWGGLTHRKVTFPSDATDLLRT